MAWIGRFLAMGLAWALLGSATTAGGGAWSASGALIAGHVAVPMIPASLQQDGSAARTGGAPGSLVGAARLRGGPVQGGLVQDGPDAAAPVPRVASRGGSLFAGIEGRSLLAPLPDRPSPEVLPDGLVQASFSPDQAGLGAFQPMRGFSPIARGSYHADRIRHLIAQAEAGPAGYDAVQYGARVRPAGRPTRMSIREIYAWIDATPGQPHAIGRYQFIPSTLRRLVQRLGVDERMTFSPAVQDRLADLLLEEAGLTEVLAGRMSRRGFMNNLAKIWAGLPNSTGRSHYDGYAGNKATMSWARFDDEMARIFPG